jgi:GAF domain-containing protein
MTEQSGTDTINDPRRLLALGRIDFDNPGLGAELDRIVARTAERTGMPISAATLVLNSAQVFAGSSGLAGWLAESRGTPVEWSFCADAVRSGRPYVVEDARTDPRQSGNPLVSNDIVGSYAGVPIVVDGQVLGAHCVIGDTAHIFSDDDLAEIGRTSSEIASILERYPKAR